MVLGIVKDRGPIFSQYGPEKTRSTRDLIRTRHTTTANAARDSAHEELKLQTYCNRYHLSDFLYDNISVVNIKHENNFSLQSANHFSASAERFSLRSSALQRRGEGRGTGEREGEGYYSVWYRTGLEISGRLARCDWWIFCISPSRP